MKLPNAFFVCLLLTGCSLEGLQSITSEPVARFQIYQERTDNSGSQIGCGVDTTGLLPTNYYEGLADDVLVIGHETINAENRCKRDILTRLNGHVAFDLSELSPPRSVSTGSRQITSALLAARINNAPDFHGGGIGCRTSTAGMLENVFWLIGRDFYPDTPPDLSNPPKSIHITRLSTDDREVGISQWFWRANPPLDVVEASRGGGGIIFSLDERSLSALQSLVDRRAFGLERFGLYFIGTNRGSTSRNQTCLQHFENIRLTVFFRDA